MAAIVGQLLEILAVPELAQLYGSSIREMQPAELVRRLGSERVSTRGHMPELRGRLLRLEALKLRPELEVPWYPEDFGGAVEEPAVQNRDDELLNKFFRVARYQETELRKTRSRLSATRREEAKTDVERCRGDRFHAVLAKLNETMKEYLTGGEDITERNQRMEKPTLDSSAVGNGDEIIDESEHIFDENLDEETQGKKNDESEYIFDENLDEEAQGNTNDESESDRSSDSIVKISSDQESFENLDEESTGSWDKDSWWGSSMSSVCTKRMAEID